MKGVANAEEAADVIPPVLAIVQVQVAVAVAPVVEVRRVTVEDRADYLYEIPSAPPSVEYSPDCIESAMNNRSVFHTK